MKNRPRNPHHILIGACVLCSCVCLTRGSAQPAPKQSSPTAPGGKGAQLAPKAPSPEVQKAAKQWEVAAKFHSAKKYKEAIAAYYEFLKIAQEAKLPADAVVPALQNLSAIYRSQGKAAELLETLKIWSALAPNNAALHAELSSIYASPNVHKFDLAADEARKTLALKPPTMLQAAAHSTLGMIAAADKNYAAAEQEFGASAQLVPKNAQLQYNYGLALVERKKFAPALAAMKKASALNPKLVGAWYYAGLINENLAKFPDAIKAFREAIKRDPRNPALHFDVARVHLRTNDVESAISEYLTCLEFAPTNLPARIAVAQLYVQIHNYAAGRVQYTEAAKLAPKNAPVLAALAECEMQISNQPQDSSARTRLLKQAEEHLKTAAAIEPRFMVGPSSLARYYERIGSFDKAQEIYKKKIAADPSDFMNVSWLAETYIMQRKPDDAIAIWRKYRDSHPENAAAYARIADSLESQGKWLEAAEEWKLLLKQKQPTGTIANAMVAIGKDLTHAGKNKEAVEQLEAVLKLDTTGSQAAKETKVADSATVKAMRISAMQGLAQIAETGNDLDGAIRWQQQIKGEEAATAEKSNTAPISATYLTLARLYRRAQKPDLAIKELDALTLTRQTVRENLAPAYEELAQVYESQMRYDEAINAYRMSSRFSKEPLNGRLKAAEVYQRSNRLPLAIAEFEAIRKEFPKETRVLAPLALAYRQANRDEDALRIYDELLKDPRATWARDQKAVVLSHLKRYDDAVALYEDALKQSPLNRQPYADIAFVFQAQNKADAFLDWAVPRLDKNPENPTLMAVILDEAIRQHKEDYGWTILRTSAEKHSGMRAVGEQTAALMMQRGKKEDALAIYKQIARQYPKDLQAQVTLADQLFAAGHKEDATKLYTDLIARTDIGPSEKLNVRRSFVRCCDETGNAAEALTQLQLIVNADPDDFDSASKLALKLEAAGREIEAIPVLDKLAAREVYSPIVRSQIRCKIGSLYLKKGDKPSAEAQYRKALELNAKNSTAVAALEQLTKKP